MRGSLRLAAVATSVFVWVFGLGAAEVVARQDVWRGRAPAGAVAPRDAGVSTGLSSLDRLPDLDPSVQVGQASSHAPDGSNVDYGHYLYRDSKGRYVLMEATGPGAITRFWMTRGLQGDTDRIEIFFDGESHPRVDLPSSEFFAGRTAPFIAPLCGDVSVSSGGDYCELRMPFRNSVRVAVTGAPPYFNIGYETYPSGAGVQTFDPSSRSTQRHAAQQARLLSRAGSDPMILPPRGRKYAGGATLAAGHRRLLAEIKRGGTIGALKVALRRYDDVALHDLWLEGRVGRSGVTGSV